MFTKTSQYLSTVLVIFGLLFAVACSTDSAADSDHATLEVRMHDAPANYEEVNIFVEEVAVNRTGSDEGWTVISEPQQQYNLLELTNGAFAVLADTEIEAGTYQQIRLIVSRDDNSVVVDGETQDLKVPSGAESGVKLNVHADIPANGHFVLMLDFDAAQSVVQTGPPHNPGYILRPVIRASVLEDVGNIAGTVVPAETRSVAYALLDADSASPDTVSTTFADLDTGEFMLVGLEENTYTVSIEPREEGFSGTRIDGVAVTAGETTELGEIELDEEDDGDDDEVDNDS